MTTVNGMEDLAPEIFRKRIVLEGYPESKITEIEIKEYLSQLATVCGMTTLLDPVTHNSEKYGWAGWTHWETSGAHFYGWVSPLSFFSVDIYTCKDFSVEKVVDFTRNFFNATEIVYKEF